MKLSGEINIIEIITIVFSVAAVVISWQGRKNTLRENVYNRQLDALQAIYARIIDLEELVSDLSVAKKRGETDEIEELDDKIDECWYDIDKLYSKLELFIPEAVADDYHKFYVDFSSSRMQLLTGEISEINYNELSGAVFDLQDSFRRFIGLEKLSKSNQRIIGESRRQHLSKD